MFFQNIKLIHSFIFSNLLNMVKLAIVYISLSLLVPYLNANKMRIDSFDELHNCFQASRPRRVNIPQVISCYATFRNGIPSCTVPAPSPCLFLFLFPAEPHTSDEGRLAARTNAVRHSRSATRPDPQQRLAVQHLSLHLRCCHSELVVQVR